MTDVLCGHTDMMASCKRLSYAVGTKLQAVEVALKVHEILYGISGLLCGCPKSLQQRVHRVCCPPPVLYVVFTDHGHPDKFIDVMAFHYPCLLVPVAMCTSGCQKENSAWASNNNWMVINAGPLINAGYYKPMK